MCCAVEHPNLLQQMGVPRQVCFSYVLSKKMQKNKAQETTSKKENKDTKEPTQIEGPCVKPKVKPHVNCTVEKEKEKKKKWRNVPLTDFGFNLSLFPGPTRPTLISPEDEVRIIEKIESQLEEYDTIVDRYHDFDTNETELFEGNCKKMEKLSRVNRDRKIRKAGKQVKDKYCMSVKNNKGRKRLYIHHRLSKLIKLEFQCVSNFLPKYFAFRNIDIRASANKSTNGTRKPNYSNPVHNATRAPVQNLRFALQNTNASADLEADLVNVLINLQHRDLTPEDYDLLLRLDEKVAPKTIDKSVLDNFKTDTVDSSSAGDICPVCMEAYEIGQDRKFLPCIHVFHSKCINMWLENSSRNCPIDGLPVDEKS